MLYDSKAASDQLPPHSITSSSAINFHPASGVQHHREAYDFQVEDELEFDSDSDHFAGDYEDGYHPAHSIASEQPITHIEDSPAEGFSFEGPYGPNFPNFTIFALFSWRNKNFICKLQSLSSMLLFNDL
jgi:hypothetical protein